MIESPRSPEPVDPNALYVGYLPVPGRVRRFLRWAVPTIIAAIAATALVVARSQPDPGPAVWDTDRTVTLSGVLWADPYPCLYADDRGDGRPGAILLVEEGKRGAGAGAAAKSGSRVRAVGHRLARDDQQILELIPGEGALTVEPTLIAPTKPESRSRGRATIRGEIVDFKCYLGAMKPGCGRPHKECATLCVRGGIPPVLVADEPIDGRVCFVLVNPDGGRLDAAAYPFIADRVEVSGELEDRAGLSVLRVDARDIRRR